MAFNIADLFEHSADLLPDRTAVVVGDRRSTYRELEERANRLADDLAEHGVGVGDHVGVYSYNSLEFIETMLAAFKLRAVPINVNFRYVEAELAYIFDNADLVALVYQRQFAQRVAAVAPGASLLRHVIVIEDGDGDNDGEAYGDVTYEDAMASGSPDRRPAERTDDDLYVLYTGGTTGMPKGVIWRHEDVFRTLGGGMDFQTGEKVTDEWALAKAAVESPPRVSFPVAPLMHGAAQWGALGGLFNGNTVVLIPRFEPHGVWATIEREHVNTLAITGDAMARPLVEALLENGYDTSSLIVISSSAAIFSPSVKDQFLELLPNVMISDAVGSSETGYSGATLVQKGAQQKGGGPTVKLGPDTIVIDEGGKPVEPGSGVIGKVARSGNVPLGYYKDPEKTAATFVTIDGRRYAIPGDFALVEADGSMTLLGRGSVSINSGGEKLFPEEIEGALKSHPAVFDCLVVGVPDERWGQRAVAVVQARPGQVPTLEDLQAHARRHIAGYKVPRSMHLVDEVKRQPSGKPDYVWAQEYAAKAEATAG